jgi:hypothetical protein
MADGRGLQGDQWGTRQGWKVEGRGLQGDQWGTRQGWTVEGRGLQGDQWGTRQGRKVEGRGLQGDQWGNHEDEDVGEMWKFDCCRPEGSFHFLCASLTCSSLLGFHRDAHQSSLHSCHFLRMVPMLMMAMGMILVESTKIDVK